MHDSVVIQRNSKYKFTNDRDPVTKSVTGS